MFCARSPAWPSRSLSCDRTCLSWVPSPSPGWFPSVLHGTRSTHLPQGIMLTSQGRARLPCAGHCPISPAGVAQVPPGTTSPLKCRDEPIFQSNIDVASQLRRRAPTVPTRPRGTRLSLSFMAWCTQSPGNLRREVCSVHGVIRRERRPGSASKPDVPQPTFLLEKGSDFRRHDRRTWGCNRLIFSLTGHDGRRLRGSERHKPARAQCDCTSSTSEVVSWGRAGPPI